SGNIWYLFKYLHENQKHINIVGVTSVKSTYDLLKSMKANVVYADSCKSLFYGLRAKVFIISGEMNYDIPNFSKYNTVKVHLFHGVPLKQIYYMSSKMVERYNNRS